MRKISLLVLTVLALGLTTAPTAAQFTINNEEVCSQPGYNMDPRCEGR
jgi:hypothetical protein